MNNLKKYALLSVSDRTGLSEFANQLVSLGFTLVASEGTKKFLEQHGLSATSVDALTRWPEMLDGRVKTLHPAIHGGLLGKLDNSSHIADLEKHNIVSFDVAVVNLYPFVEGLNSDKAGDPLKMTELVDIGGPAMIRAAAKNHRFVLPLIDPSDYPQAAVYLSAGEVPLDFRVKMAAKVFGAIAKYDLAIAQYFSELEVVDTIVCRSSGMPSFAGLCNSVAQSLRYGENPQQQAAYYADKLPWIQHAGKELSYNNILDLDAALQLLGCFSNSLPTAAIIKHLNPCGVATAASLSEALILAKQSDPRSHFGGIIGFNKSVDGSTAKLIAEDFAEIVVAPSYSVEALSALKEKKNLRIIEINSPPAKHELRSVVGGFLAQSVDTNPSDVNAGTVPTKRRPTEAELSSLQFVWNICKYVKSNSIVVGRDTHLLGVGAGQMSRIDSVEVALLKAKTHEHNLVGAVAASDAFFPFSDGLERLAEAGITAVVAPSGAKKDAEVIAAADRLGVSLVLVQDRHFRH